MLDPLSNTQPYYFGTTTLKCILCLTRGLLCNTSPSLIYIASQQQLCFFNSCITLLPVGHDLENWRSGVCFLR